MNWQTASSLAYEDAGNEAYHLEVSDQGVSISAYAPAGLLMGIQTLRQLLPADIEDENTSCTEWNVPAADITDWPRYGFRSVMLDICRHYFTPEAIMRQIDLMSQFKINTLHLHLTEDQATRIAFDSYPELEKFAGTTKMIETLGVDVIEGNQEDFFNTPGSIQYGQKADCWSKDDYKRVVEYAASRYIEIIPEIETPAHNSSLLRSLPLLNANNEFPQAFLELTTNRSVGHGITLDPNKHSYTKEFLDNVIEELAEMTPGRYIHIGGDEAPNMSHEEHGAVTSYVIDKVHEQGKLTIQWMQANARKKDFPATDLFQNWSESGDPGENSRRAVEAGSKVIASNSNRAYLDQPTSKAVPLGLTWAAPEGIDIYTAYSWDPESAVAAEYQDQGIVVGVETPLWSETLGYDWTQDAMMYPKLMGYAELSWSQKEDRESGDASTNEAYLNYKDRLSAQLPRMENEDIVYFNYPELTEEKKVVLSERLKEVTTPMNTPISGTIPFEAGDNTSLDEIELLLGGTPTQGTLEFDQQGNWTYTPVKDFAGTDSFTILFNIKDHGIPVGSKFADNGISEITIQVEKDPNTVIDVNAEVTDCSSTNINVKLDPPVPGLTLNDFSVENSRMRYAQTFDNGSTYVLITDSRSADPAALKISKDGYSFSEATAAFDGMQYLKVDQNSADITVNPELTDCFTAEEFTLSYTLDTRQHIPMPYTESREETEVVPTSSVIDGNEIHFEFEPLDIDEEATFYVRFKNMILEDDYIPAEIVNPDAARDPALLEGSAEGSELSCERNEAILNLSGSLEADQYAGIDLGALYALESLEAAGLPKGLIIETSTEGVKWSAYKASDSGDLTTARYVRLHNTSGKALSYEGSLKAAMAEYKKPVVKNDRRGSGNDDGMYANHESSWTFDGDYNTLTSFIGSEREGTYIQLDLGGIYALNSIGLAVDLNEGWGYNPPGNLLVSTDGQNWTNAGYIDTYPEEKFLRSETIDYYGYLYDKDFYTYIGTIDNLGGIRARYIRFESTDWEQYTDSIHINEFMVNGEDGYHQVIKNLSVPKLSDGNISLAAYDLSGENGSYVYDFSSSIYDARNVWIWQTGDSHASVEYSNLYGEWKTLGTLNGKRTVLPLPDDDSVCSIRLTWEEGDAPVLCEISRSFVDTTQLYSLLSSAEQKDLSLYTPATASVLDQAMTAARKFVSQPDQSQEENDRLVSLMNNALDGLQEKASEAGLEALRQRVDAARALDSSSPELEALIAQAQALLADPDNASADDVSRILFDLSMEMRTLEDQKTNKLREDLEATIKEAAAILEEQTANVRPGQIEALKTALENGQAVLDNPESSDEELQDAMNQISAAVQELWKIVSKTELNRLIEMAGSLNESDYSPETWNALQQALEAARAVAGNDDATLAEVTDAIASLSSAIAGLKTPLTLDFSALQYEVDLAGRILDHADDYVPDSIKGLDALLEQGKAVLNNAQSQEEIDAAAAALRQARLNARTKADKKALEELLAKADALTLEDYEEESLGRFRQAYSRARDVFDNPAATQEEVDAAIKELQEAMEALKPVGSDKSEDKIENKTPSSDKKDKVSASGSEKSTKQDKTSAKTPSASKSVKTAAMTGGLFTAMMAAAGTAGMMIFGKRRKH